jgi:hypothetical protein
VGANTNPSGLRLKPFHQSNSAAPASSIKTSEKISDLGPSARYPGFAGYTTAGMCSLLWRIQPNLAAVAHDTFKDPLDDFDGLSLARKMQMRGSAGLDTEPIAASLKQTGLCTRLLVNQFQMR